MVLHLHKGHTHTLIDLTSHIPNGIAWWHCIYLQSRSGAPQRTSSTSPAGLLHITAHARRHNGCARIPIMLWFTTNGSDGRWEFSCTTVINKHSITDKNAHNIHEHLLTWYQWWFSVKNGCMKHARFSSIIDHNGDKFFISTVMYTWNCLHCSLIGMAGLLTKLNKPALENCTNDLDHARATFGTFDTRHDAGNFVQELLQHAFHQHTLVISVVVAAAAGYDIHVCGCSPINKYHAGKLFALDYSFDLWAWPRTRSRGVIQLALPGSERREQFHNNIRTAHGFNMYICPLKLE